uniref:Uncharacterized protein n=1 Tax=Romanomermis culicivorax TaxID=13658 RepID=A0A915HXS3_ROMCU
MTEMLAMQTTTSMTPLSKSLSYITKHIDWDKKDEYRAETALIKMILLKDISKGEEESEPQMMPLQIIPTRHNILKMQEPEVTAPVSTDSWTPILEIKDN